FAHVYAAMDRVTARTESYTALLAMSSTRIYRFEAINNAGSSGWYLGDGVLLLHGGSASDYQSARYSSMDKLRIPGTTVSSYKRENVGYTTDTGLLNRSAFVGGAYSDDYAAAAMFLAYSPADKMGNFVSDLVAQKAYFFFDDEIVCVGAGINADYTAGGKTNVGDVYTIIENVSGTGRTLFVNGRQTSLSENVETVSAGVGYATLSGWCGYVFPEATDVTMQRKSNGMFQMFVDHGAKPVNAAYAYVMLPGASDAETAAYAAAPDVEIVCASNIVTHVVETTLGVEGYVFWYGTYYDGIRTTDGAIILRETNADGSVTYRVSEPTQLLSTLTLTLDGAYTVTGENLTWSVSGGQTVVTLTTNGALGATFTFTVTPN
ncbi:MAG: hypothetical protein J6125_02785, partial [Clostridia bacterium]|nr:hypothetical protein [Clostridia bacterium]